MYSICRVSGTFDVDFNLTVRKISFNHQIQVTAKYYFQEDMVVCLRQSFANLPD